MTVPVPEAARGFAVPGAASVSVLLPAWNEAVMIERCLESLLALNWPELEIIICAGGDDATLEISRSYAGERVTVLEQRPGEGKQAALRRCFAHSRGEVLYLTDADCIVPNEVFQAVVEPVACGEVAACTGTSCPAPDQRIEPFALYQWSISRASERRRSEVSTGLLGRNCAVRRDALIRAGSFREHVPIGTDYHLAKSLLKQGEQIRFVPAAVRTFYPTQAGEFVRQQSRWLRNIFLHGPRFGDYDEMRDCGRTIALGTGFYLWPLTWRWTRLPGIALWLAGLAFLVAVRLKYARTLASETGSSVSRSYLLRLPFYTLLDVAAWTWPLLDAASSRRRLRW